MSFSTLPTEIQRLIMAPPPTKVVALNIVAELFNEDHSQRALNLYCPHSKISPRSPLGVLLKNSAYKNSALSWPATEGAPLQTLTIKIEEMGPESSYIQVFPGPWEAVLTTSEGGFALDKAFPILGEFDPQSDMDEDDFTWNMWSYLTDANRLVWKAFKNRAKLEAKYQLPPCGGMELTHVVNITVCDMGKGWQTRAKSE